jgi:hypothetical protein
VAQLGGACEVCGYRKYIRALTFHHLDPSTKRFNIAPSHTRSWDELYREVARCVLLCSNCHREVEGGVAEIPLAVRRRVEEAIADVERVPRRRSGRPALSDPP